MRQNKAMKFSIIILIAISSLSLYLNQQKINTPVKTIQKTLYSSWVVKHVEFNNINCQKYSIKDMVNTVNLSITNDTISGNGPVNTFNGTITIKENLLNITQLNKTKMFGIGECVEKELMTFLKSDLIYTLDHKHLTLTSDQLTGITSIQFK